MRHLIRVLLIILVRKMRNKLVAIIDDDVDFSRMLSSRLNEIGFEAVVIHSSLELISVLCIDRPGYIVIDMMLNWIDPLGLINSLKKNPELRDIKVFLVTEQRPEEITSLKDGLSYQNIMYKPFAFENLIDRLREEVYDNEPN